MVALSFSTPQGTVSLTTSMLLLRQRHEQLEQLIRSETNKRRRAVLEREERRAWALIAGPLLPNQRDRDEFLSDELSIQGMREMAAETLDGGE